MFFVLQNHNLCTARKGTILKRFVQLIVLIFILFAFAKGARGLTTTTLECEVLVAGGGAGLICAAIQSARLGAETICVEKTFQLGGMLTTADSKVIYSNYMPPTGLWGEFRGRLYEYYGGGGRFNTALADNTTFEPHVGSDIFRQMAEDEENLNCYYGFRVVRILKGENRITGGVFRNDNDDNLVINTKISIAADELGDFLNLSKDLEGLIAIEKGISAIHIENGCVNLLPCMMAAGQAAGAAAALSVIENLEPREIPLRKLQQTLLDAKCWCLPFVDVPPERWSFQAVQRAGLAGVLKGTGVPQERANRTFFDPEENVERIAAGESLAVCLSLDHPPTTTVCLEDRDFIPRSEAVQAVYELLDSPLPAQNTPYYNDTSSTHPAFAAIQFGYENSWFESWAEPPQFHPAQFITREEFAALLDRSLDPFNTQR